MISSTITPASGVSFQKQFNGYDRDEVDRYIKNISEAYQTAFDEYTAVCDERDKLLEECKELGAEREQNKSNATVIAKTLIDAETLVQKIIADAHAEADKIIEEAQAAAQKTRDDAYTENAVAKIQAQKTISEANAEAAGIRDQANGLIDNAQIEAAKIEARTKRNLEHANEKIMRMISEMQGLLTSYTLDE